MNATQNSSALRRGRQRWPQIPPSSSRRRHRRRHRSPSTTSSRSSRSSAAPRTRSFTSRSAFSRSSRSSTPPDVRGQLARASSPKNKQNLLDSFRVLLSKSANTASLALAFGFWSFEETFGARKMQLVLSLKAAGKWPLPALPAAATERSGRLVVLGLRWQQAGFAKHYHALLPLNIGLGIRVRSTRSSSRTRPPSRPPPARWSAWRRRRSCSTNSTSRRSGGRRGPPSTSTT